MYRQMDIWLPGREGGPQQSRTTGRDLRKLLARLNTEHQIGLPPQFFGYDDGGAPDFTARPSFMLGENSQDSVRIVAIGPEASQTLLETSGPIQAALIRDYKALVHATMRGGAHAIEPSGGNGYARCRYHAHRDRGWENHFRILVVAISCSVRCGRPMERTRPFEAGRPYRHRHL